MLPPSIVIDIDHLCALRVHWCSSIPPRMSSGLIEVIVRAITPASLHTLTGNPPAPWSVYY
jgi:hypothetical protein